ncbi:MAG: DUF6443 domain-containing protein, partial [Bacteroidota bacterium]
MKKYILILLLFLVIGGSVIAQNIDGTQNYVRSTTARIPIEQKSTFETLKINGAPNEKIEAIQYLDGLGRPIQTVDWKTSPGRQDMV